MHSIEMDDTNNEQVLKEQLKELIRGRAYKKHSLFKTPSGIVRTFFDFLEISLKHRGVEIAGQVVYNEIKDLDINAIGGPSHGITSILCRAAFLKKIGVFYIRDSIKKDGDINAPKWIESRIKDGDKLAIVGDVVSSGSLILRSIEEILQLGGEIKKIVVILDAQEGGGIGAIQKYLRTNMLDIPLRVIFTREEILKEPDLPQYLND